jgi:hypothetical protein
MNIDQTTVHGTQGFNMENLTDGKGKYHGRQPTNLHYTRSVQLTRAVAYKRYI